MTRPHVDAILADDPQGVVKILNEQFSGRMVSQLRTLSIEDVLQIIAEAITGESDGRPFLDSPSWRIVGQQIIDEAASLPPHAIFGGISYTATAQEEVTSGLAKAARVAVQAGKSTFVYDGMTYTLGSHQS